MKREGFEGEKKRRKYYRIEEMMKLAKKYNVMKKMKMDEGDSLN